MRADERRRALRVGGRALRDLFLPAAVLVTLATTAAVYRGKDPGLLFRDPAAIADIHPLLGVFSNLGALAWCAAATVAVFTAVLSRRLAPADDSWRFFAACGALTTLLLVDDFFMAHELADEYLGAPQAVSAIVYAGVLLGLLVGFRRQLARTDYVILLLGAGFLGFSAAFDVLHDRIDPSSRVGWMTAIEDGSKFLGILGWCAYLVQTGFRHSVEILRRGAAGSGTASVV